MKNTKNESLQTFLTLKENGNDLNEQFKTVQGTSVITNEHGVKWDRELEKLLSILLRQPFRFLLDDAHFYVYCDDSTYIQVPYLIYGEEQGVYVDFNSMKLIQNQLSSTFIVVVYKGEKEGETYFTNVIPNESKERAFIVTKNPEGTILISKEHYHDTLLEALNELDKEMEREDREELDEEWKLSDYIEEKLTEKGISKSELAEKVAIKYKTLISKFKINSITGEELIRISIVLDLDLNELKSIYMRKEEHQTPPKKEVRYIASLVKIGFTSGIVPAWELMIPQKQLYPLTIEEQHLVAEQIEDGYTTGYLKGDYPRTWKLKMGDVLLTEHTKNQDTSSKIKEELKAK